MSKIINQEKFVCLNESDLISLIDQYFNKIKQYKIVLLEGDLGSGKTTFVRYLAKKLNIKENITSPSFSYMKIYNGLVHIDLYNFKGELDEFEDYFEDNIVAIEWANLKTLSFSQYLLIKASMKNDLHFFEIMEIK
ncbi:tRNA (adenosine(37)-N6)-threonylcarbamoyltransferase complex ATPase subunit type 1 TsaE [Mycoplasmopsis cricetuli]|uniref:tRNA (adenosine(37)-N6)-threonylcarbamoyltransferase complex ATPase subunit type 1 TsaE n=1 Tax=Mycoplasmopsis cricetuli TaxID=171283 RepID=UPI00055D9DED|nr:tRNA (adenosine(37)-N6)-threonylcarbamoyltransferase complex ATPase subunit type 1 TsaE [Mycoplasmopsis cricetuli]